MQVTQTLVAYMPGNLLPMDLLIRKCQRQNFLFIDSVRKQLVNVPSFIVRLDSQKHIDFALNSPYGGGRPGRVKRKNLKKKQGGGSGGEEEDED